MSLPWCHAGMYYFLLMCFLIAGQVKLSVHTMRLCQLRGGSDSNDDIKSQTLVALLCLLEGRKAFNNIFLRHHLFCILQVLGGRWAPPFSLSIFCKIEKIGFL